MILKIYHEKYYIKRLQGSNNQKIHFEDDEKEGIPEYNSAQQEDFIAISKTGEERLINRGRKVQSRFSNVKGS